MSANEAKTFGITEIDRKQFVRVDSGKVNVTKAAGEAKWFRIVGVRLAMPLTFIPMAMRFRPSNHGSHPRIWSDFGIDLLNQALTQIDAGLPDGNRYSDSPHTREERAAWRVITTLAPTPARSLKHG